MRMDHINPSGGSRRYHVVIESVAVPAHATYPGAVGRIAFGMAGPNGNGNISSVLPNGRGLRRLTDDSSDDLLPLLLPQRPPDRVLQRPNGRV
jgi:hypothetical protein